MPEPRPSDEDTRPPSVPGLTLGRPLGAGGFAVVWEALDERSGPLALKVARAADGLTRERFRREGDAMSRIGPPHVPRLIARGDLEDGRPWLAMELVSAPTLADALAALKGPPEEGWVRAVASALLGAIEAVHGAGFVHRDLKPENVFLDASPPRARLFDFGLTRTLAGSRLTAAGPAVGTLEYMAPEQILGGEQDRRTDVYAFGAILYELLTLRPPFVGDPAAVEHGHLWLRPPKPRDLCPVDEVVEEIALACLSKTLEKRPQDMSAIGRMLKRPGRTTQLRMSSLVPRTAQVMGDARLPVVFLSADGLRGGEAAIVSAHRGFVARQHGARTLFAFASLSVEHPAEAGLAAARQIVARGGRAALHLAEVAVLRKDHGPPLVHGRDAERPDTWRPKEPWAGLHMTEAFSAALPPSAAADELVGRGDLLALARSSLEAAQDGTGPSLLTLLGEDGVGKTRLAQALADLARKAGARVITARGGNRRAKGGISLGKRLRAMASRGPLALIVDDADRAGDARLDAIEYATLDGSGVKLWVCVLAQPSLRSKRQRWGERAFRQEEHVLGPLLPDDAATLAERLLRPAEYVPRRVLERLAAWSGGSPAHLGELVCGLQRDGVIRRDAPDRGWYVATALFDQLGASPAAGWVAARTLETLPPELAACVRVLSVLGTEFEPVELEHVLLALEREEAAGSPIDVDAGLQALVTRGILTRTRAGAYAFLNPRLRAAGEKLLSDKDRARVNRHAADYFRGRPGDAALARFAEHAGGAGLGGEATAAHLRLAEIARASHHHVDTDGHFTAALRFLEGTARAPALAGRGSARYRMHRCREALEDLRAAALLAQESGDQHLLIATLLEEATAADWASDFATSAVRAEEAHRLLSQSPAPDLQTRCLFALGRTHWRSSAPAQAIPLLREAAERAHTSGDYETRVVSLLLLGSALVCAGSFAEAEDRFAEVIALCTEHGDDLHLCGAYCNRLNLWTALGRPDQATSDLRQAVRLAREVGHPGTERVATYNLAELLYWNGDIEEALPLARRARELHRRFGDQPMPHDTVLVARIQVARREHAEVRALLAAAESEGTTMPDSSPAVLARALMLFLEGGSREGWDALRARAEGLTCEELLEIDYWHAASALAGGREYEATEVVSRALAELERAPVWRRRLLALHVAVESHRSGGNEPLDIPAGATPTSVEKTSSCGGAKPPGVLCNTAESLTSESAQGLHSPLDGGTFG